MKYLEQLITGLVSKLTQLSRSGGVFIPSETIGFSGYVEKNNKHDPVYHFIFSHLVWT